MKLDQKVSGLVAVNSEKQQFSDVPQNRCS